MPAGRVFDRDDGSPIANVVVSDGLRVTRSGADGTFALPASAVGYGRAVAQTFAEMVTPALEPRLDRKWNPTGPLQSASQREHLAGAALDGAGDGWVTTPAAIADLHSLILRITLDDGEKVRLTMTRGGTKLLGGDEQRDGVVAMAELAAAHRDPA